MSMHAAVVRSFDRPPRYESYPTPTPDGPDQTLVDVLAVGLHPRVRSGAAGRHYTGTGTLPMIPGVDGVGRLPGGGLIYFAVPDDVWGSMAGQAVVDPRRAVPLPDDADVAKIAAAMNPAMSAWVALRRRVPLQPGQSVLVLGATGNAGTMAVQVARRLGPAGSSARAATPSGWPRWRPSARTRRSRSTTTPRPPPRGWRRRRPSPTS